MPPSDSSETGSSASSTAASRPEPPTDEHTAWPAHRGCGLTPRTMGCLSGSAAWAVRSSAARGRAPAWSGRRLRRDRAPRHDDAGGRRGRRRGEGDPVQPLPHQGRRRPRPAVGRAGAADRRAAALPPVEALVLLADEVADHPVLRTMAVTDPGQLVALLGAGPERWAEVTGVLAAVLTTVPRRRDHRPLAARPGPAAGRPTGPPAAGAPPGRRAPPRRPPAPRADPRRRPCGRSAAVPGW